MCPWGGLPMNFAAHIRKEHKKCHLCQEFAKDDKSLGEHLILKHKVSLYQRVLRPITKLMTSCFRR